MTALTKIDPLDWQTITERIGEGKCVPFLGAAANVTSEERGYAGLPLGSDVAVRMVEKIVRSEVSDLNDLMNISTLRKLAELDRYKNLARVAAQDLGRVSLHVRHKTDFNFFTNILKNIIRDGECRPSDLLRTLARVPKMRLIVTTNYDRLMEDALNEASEPWERIVQRVNGFDQAAQQRVQEQMSDAGKRIVYKLHGTFHEEELDSAGPGGDEEPFPQLIITEDDYIRFLTVLNRQDRELEGIPRQVKEKFVHSTLLFLGYGLEDWDFRTLYKGLIEALPAHKKRLSFAIQKDPSAFWVDFWEPRGITVYNMDLYEFADQLKEECQRAGLYKEEPEAGTP